MAKTINNDLKTGKPKTGQQIADEIMESVQVTEIWRLEDNRWYTNEKKAIERNVNGGEIEHFTKTK